MLEQNEILVECDHLRDSTLPSWKEDTSQKVHELEHKHEKSLGSNGRASQLLTVLVLS